MNKGMKNDNLTLSQYRALIFCSMLSPLIRQLPAGVVGLAGRSSFLSALLGLLPALGVLWLLCRLSRGVFPGELLPRALGKAPGRFILGVFGLWLAFYGGFVLRAGADRFMAAVYPEGRVALFMAVMLLILLPAAAGRTKTVCRMAELLLGAMAALFLVVFVFALPGVDAKNLFPLEAELPSVLRGALPVSDTLLVSVWLLFLGGEREEGALFGVFARPIAALALIGALLCLTTVGSFGAALTEKMNYPFFVMIRGVRIFHLLERIEAVIAAQWVAADFLLLAALSHAAGEALRLAIAPKKARRGFSLASLALMALAGWLCAPTAFALRELARTTVPVLNAAAVALLIIIYIVYGLQKVVKENRPH